MGLMAGSCIKFDLQTNLTPEQLNQKLGHLAIVGIGERTAEGYGQISFNDPLLDRPISQLAPAMSIDVESSNTANKITSKQKSFAYARIAEKQAWRNEISNSAKALASNPTNRERLLGIKISPNNESCPSMKQLGNLQLAIAKSQKPQDIQPIVRWLESTKEKRSQKWEKTNNGLEKIEELITTQHKVWDELARYTDIPLEDLTLTENAETLTAE